MCFFQLKFCVSLINQCYGSGLELIAGSGLELITGSGLELIAGSGLELIASFLWLCEE